MYGGTQLFWFGGIYSETGLTHYVGQADLQFTGYLPLPGSAGIKGCATATLHFLCIL